MKHLNSFVNTQ